MSAFPKTEADLKSRGYVRTGLGTCRACGASIVWWRTPKQKNIPLDPDFKAHWETCPHADKFRKQAKRESTERKA